MKLYIENIKNKNINKNLLTEYKCTTKTKKIIISEQGIINLVNNEMFLLRPNDFPKETIFIDKFIGILDKSEFVNDEIWFQIPTQHILEDINVLTYELRPNGLIELVIEEKYNEIKDFYFIIKDKLCTLGWKDDVLTFLSTLKLY